MDIFKKKKEWFLSGFLICFFVIMLLPAYGVKLAGISQAGGAVYANSFGWHILFIFIPLLMLLFHFILKDEFKENHKMLMNALWFVPIAAGLIYFLVTLINLGSVREELGSYKSAVHLGVGFWLYLVWLLLYIAYVVLILFIKEKPYWTCSNCGARNLGEFCTSCGTKRNGVADNAVPLTEAAAEAASVAEEKADKVTE